MRYPRFVRLGSMAVLLCLTLSARAQGILYRAEGSAGLAGSEIYLLGSVHYGRDDMYPLPAQVDAAFDAAQVMLVEIDILNLDSAQVGKLMAERGYYPPGDSLQRRLQPAHWERLTSVLGKVGMNEALIARMRPWMAAITIVDVLAREQGLSAERGIDLHLLQRTRSRPKTIVSLETLDSQLRVFWELDPDQQVQYLTGELERLDESQHVLADMIELWKRGDGPGIDALLHQSMVGRGLDSLYERLIVQRNRDMLAAVLEHARAHERLLVVVGVGHLVGKTGLVEGLRQAGFEVEKQL
ncbi:MAG: TraB/GumN family protein [Gammaproteobacteria bacterium]|nr:TraB/GumN family protein [Gammaproteobacteria bacterium]